MIDLVAELESLLAAWRERRASKLAGTIEELSSWFELAIPDLDGTARNERHFAWLDRAKKKRVVEVSFLLKHVGHGTHEQATYQLDEVAKWKPDPRTTPFANHMFKWRPFATSSGTQKVWRRLFDVILQNGDPRMKSSLASRSISKVFSNNERGAKMRLRATNVLAELEEIREVPSPDDDVWAARIEKELASGKAVRDAVRIHEGEEGEEQQYAESLLVYRDWLMERGFTPIA